MDISKPDELPRERDVNLICQVSSLRVIKTKKGTLMASLVLTNYQGSIEAVIFPKVFQELGEKIQDDGIYGFTGRFDERRDGGGFQFIISNAVDPKELPSEAVRSIGLALDSALLAGSEGDHYLNEVISFLIEHSGSLPLNIYLDDRKDQYVKSSFSVSYYKEIRKDLAAFPVIRNVYIA